MNLKIEQWPVDRLRKYERNARTHPDEQIGQITASIKEFGFVNPVLVDKDGTLIAGHGRLDGARNAGLETLPVIQLGHLTEAQANALRIADNRIPMSAGWDANLLQAELTELSGAGYDMPLLGFDEPELFDYMAAPTVVQESEFPFLTAADRPPFQRMAFILHDEQVEIVKLALSAAKNDGPFLGTNENSNANALERICSAYSKSHSSCSDKAKGR